MVNSIATVLAVHAVVAFLAGALAAQVYCRLLVHEVKSLTRSRLRGLRMVFGAVFRIALTGAALVLIGDGEWVPTVAALAGFSLARWRYIRRVARALA